MCLLIVLSRLHPDAPLVVAANRDEFFTRVATPMTVLHERDPRILGGRDELAGGTWLAVNEAGVVAGLTNRPNPDGRDPAKRSRGELPVMLARHRDAGSAVTDLVRRIRPSDYNPAWLLVGDRRALYALDLTGGDTVGVEELGPGLHILENRPYHDASPKVARMRALLEPATSWRGEDLAPNLALVLSDHVQPADLPPVAGEPARRPETMAACVHTDDYGTRSASIIVVPAGASERPSVEYADAAPCRSARHDAGALWEHPPPRAGARVRRGGRRPAA